MRPIAKSTFLIGLLLAAIFSRATQAQTPAWPARAITMVVPFPPGGLADLVARPVAEAMSRDLGQPVMIENKAGAAPAVVALLGGQIDAISSGPATVLQHVKAGKLKVLAHWGTGRLASMPDVPSLAEAGLQAE